MNSNFFFLSTFCDQNSKKKKKKALFSRSVERITDYTYDWNLRTPSLFQAYLQSSLHVSSLFFSKKSMKTCSFFHI